RATMPRILNAMLGTKFKIVLGYSPTASLLAVERGEADGICGMSWATMKAATPDWVQNNRLNVLIQVGAKPHPALPNVPLVFDHITNPDDREVVELLFFPQEMGRPFMMPPDTPKEFVAIIRRAFDDTMKDPAFLADGEKSLLEVDPLTGEEMEQILKRAYATPKALIERAGQFNGSGGQRGASGNHGAGSPVQPTNEKNTAMQRNVDVLVRCVLALSAMLSCASAARAQAPIVVSVGAASTTSDAPIYIADKKGYFREEGLAAKVTNFRSAADMVAPLGIGQLDAGAGS